MHWHDLRADWSTLRDRLTQRFPHLDDAAVASPPDHQSDLARILADTHDLTVFEAAEELADFLSVEALARQLM